MGTIKSRVARGRVALEALMSGTDMAARRGHKVDTSTTTLDKIMNEVDTLSRGR